MPNKQDIIDVAKQCFDPEIPVNIWDLGLIYDIEFPSPEKIAIRMSLTSEHCPEAEAIPLLLKRKIEEAHGIKDIEVNVTFDPPWTPERMTEEAKRLLGITE